MILMRNLIDRIRLANPIALTITATVSLALGLALALVTR